MCTSHYRAAIMRYNAHMRARIAALVAFVGLLPSLALAFPFGGQINQIIFCYNDAIYTNLGPPRGGPFIWTPSTRTYRFGPPLRSGQWLLGLAAPPYYCIVSKQPIIVWSGILMTMEASSGSPAPAYQPGQGASGLGGVSGLNGGGFGTDIGTQAGVDHVVISEVYAEPDAAHGSTPAHEWIELFNPTTSSVDISRWVIKTAQAAQSLPANTSIPAKGYVIVAPSAVVRTDWNIASSTQVVVVENVFGTELRSAGDRLLLLTAASSSVDALSWGDDTSVMSPAATAATVGRALIRSSLARDTNVAQEWVVTSAPTPGR